MPVSPSVAEEHAVPPVIAVADLPGRPCSIASTLSVIGDRWALLALREVFFGNRRFNEIARNTGAPRDRLAARLRGLVEAGILDRREYQTSPSRSEYFLTAAGKDLAPVLRAMLAWGDTWVSDSPPAELVHHRPEHEEHVFVAEQHCATCGEAVRDRDIRVRSRRPEWSARGPVGDGA
jgi:DNA-binding HxlR family transcriptional regulator